MIDKKELSQRKSELKRMQSYPLELKVAKAKARIKEFIDRFGEDGVYVSFSGGKDSTVLLNLVREDYPNVPAVFCDTGLEFPEIKEFVKTYDNVVIIRPKKSFREVLTNYGYPIISKQQAQYIYGVRHGPEATKRLHLYGGKGGCYKLSKKWHFCLDAPFEISHHCCYHLKKSPFNSFARKTGRHPMMGILVEESYMRLTEYYKSGCNAMDNTQHPRSRPLSIWTNNDILEYLDKNNIDIAPVYGEIKKDEDGNYYTTGEKRTGCVFCAFGAHCEDSPNRYQRLKNTHPNLWRYCIKGGEYNEDGFWIPNNEGLGFAKVLDFMNIEYE